MFYNFFRQAKLWNTIDVTEAVEAGIRVAESMTGVVQHYVIPNPEPGTQKMLKISALDKD